MVCRSDKAISTIQINDKLCSDHELLQYCAYATQNALDRFRFSAISNSEIMKVKPSVKLSVSSGVFDHVRFKPACSATEASYNSETLDIASIHIILFKQRRTKEHFWEMNSIS